MRITPLPVRFVSVLTMLLGAAMLTGAGVSATQEAAAPTQNPTQAQAKPADHPEFPQGAGRDTTLRLCSKCHSPNNILAMGRDRQGWSEVITKMADMGAQGTDEDFTAILDYLTASFPPAPANTTKTSNTSNTPTLNINKAPASQIATTLTLTTDEANRLVAYREKNGDFKTLDDLKKVPGVDAKKLDARKDAITF